MESVTTRKGARVVAYVDIVSNLLGLIATIMALVLSREAFERQAKANRSISDDDAKKMTAVVLWIIGCVITGMVIAKIWIAVLLLKATEEDADLALSLKRARIWQSVTGVLAMIQILLLVKQFDVPILIGILIQCMLMYFVYKFIAELRTKQNDTPA